jgi:hypothetical protein
MLTLPSLFALIYCFLSTCLGLHLRRADIWDSLRPPSLSDIRQRDAARRRRAQELSKLYGPGDGGDGDGEGYEMGEFSSPYERVGMGLGGGVEDIDMMRRAGRGFF